MNKSLTRSIGFWLLIVVSLASAGVGGWIISGQVGTMTSTLLDGTATGVEVYVGQSLIVVGAALLGAGVVGILLALVLTAVRSLLPVAAPVVVEPIDWNAQNTDTEAAVTPTELPAAESADEFAEDFAEENDQNGSSGSIATATKINVK